jgi:circadian clock protein KaiB
MCEQHLIGRYDLEVVDLLRSPAQAEADDITAAPTLLRVLPLPVRRIVGEIADEREMLIQLGIAAASETPG